jgi:hypothetical protein
MVRLLAFLMCESATINGNESVTLHRLFDGLQIPISRAGLPGPPHTVFFVFYKIVTEAPCTISLRIAKPSGEHVAGEWADSVTLPSAAPVTWQSIWAVSTVLFQEAGLYTLELLWSDDRPAIQIAQTQLLVEHL